jgi:hypothetical protein
MKEWTPCRINYEWQPVELDPGKPFNYPSSLNKAFIGNNSKPALYRWALKDENGLLTGAYIGETENLVRRIKGYLRPGPTQQTNIRMRKNFLDHIESGGIVELQILKFEPFGINNVNVYDESQLGNSYIRKMMENFLLADHDSVHCELKNCVANPIERRRRKSMRAGDCVGSRFGDFSAARAAANELRGEGKL